MKKNSFNLDSSSFFYLSDGSVIKNIEGLSKILEKMSEEVFRNHVSGDKNDFSNWVSDIFNEKKLSEEIRYSKTPLEMSKIIKKSLLKKSKEKDKKILDKINNSPFIVFNKIQRKKMMEKIKRSFK